MVAWVRCAACLPINCRPSSCVTHTEHGQSAEARTIESSGNSAPRLVCLPCRCTGQSAGCHAHSPGLFGTAAWRGAPCPPR
eukprot:3335100-Prymnesium_polylepis.1